MKHLKISLPEKLYEELVIAAADCFELDEPICLSPEEFAKECVESILASRRLERRSSAVA